MKVTRNCHPPNTLTAKITRRMRNTVTNTRLLYEQMRLLEIRLGASFESVRCNSSLGSKKCYLVKGRETAWMRYVHLIFPD